MVVKSKRLWKAWRTVTWWASGQKEFRQIKDKGLVYDLYAWYLGVDDEF